MTPEEIQAKIDELNEMLREAREKEAAEALAVAPVAFYAFRMVDDNLKFNYRPRRPDVNSLMESFGLSTASTNDFSIDPHLWDDIEKELIKLDRIEIPLSDEQREYYRLYTKPPDLHIRYDKPKQYIVFDNKAGVDVGFALRGNPFILFSKNYLKYVIPPSNIPDLALVLDTITKRKPNLDIKIQDEIQLLIDADLKRRDTLKRFESYDYIPEKPYILNGTTFRPYQTQCLEFLLETDGNLIVALEMGLGKTPVSMAFIHETLQKSSNTKFLIVCPASLRPNWAKEQKKYLPYAKSIQLYGSTPSSYMVKELITGDYNLIYVSYETLRSHLKMDEGAVGQDPTKVYPWAAILSCVSNLRIVMDEFHYCKNPDTANAKAFFAINNTISRTPLTGTPMKNGPKELHSLVRAVNPEIAGTYGGWITAHTYDNGRRASDPEHLRHLLLPVMFRRLKKDVLKDLPPINRITLEHELSPIAKKAYSDVLMGFYSTLDQWNGDRSNSQTINSLLAQLIRMKQICAEDKIDLVAERAVETYDSDESDYNKVIIFSQFANSPPIVPKIAAKLGGESIYFTGNDAADERFARVQAFQTDPSIHFLVASTKAASEGLDITAAGHIIFTDLMWTPADHQQAEGRAYGRMSDLHSITSTYIVSEDTIEEVIAEILFAKVSQIAKVVDGVTDESSIAMDVLAKLKGMRH